MSEPRERERWIPPGTPYVTEGSEVTIEHDNIGELAKAMVDDSSAFGGAIGNARARLFCDMGFDTGPTFGVDPRNPRAAEMMTFHDAAFERAVSTAGEHAEKGQLVGGMVGLAAGGLEKADEGARNALDEVGDRLADGWDLFTGDSEGN